MKGFEFPSIKSQPSSHRAETNSQKSEVLNILNKSERLWNQQGKKQQSLIQLRKAIELLEIIIINEKVEEVKICYIEKHKHLKVRLAQRQNRRYSANILDVTKKYVNQNFIGKKQNSHVDTSQKKTEFVNVLARSQKLWNQGKTEQSLVDLNIAILIITFVAKYEENDTFKSKYTDNLKQLKKRLIERQ